MKLKKRKIVIATTQNVPADDSLSVRQEVKLVDHKK